MGLMVNSIVDLKELKNSQTTGYTSMNSSKMINPRTKPLPIFLITSFNYITPLPYFSSMAVITCVTIKIATVITTAITLAYP